MSNPCRVGVNILFYCCWRRRVLSHQLLTPVQFLGGDMSIIPKVIVFLCTNMTLTSGLIKL